MHSTFGTASLGRLLTPAVGWLVGGTLLVAAVVAGAVLEELEPPVWTALDLSLVGTLLAWTGLLAGVGVGVGAIVNGLVLAVLQDRAEGPSDRVSHLHVALLVLLTLLAMALQITLIRWYVEDAAISFAYARNVAAGQGFATFPGGERVEGYSNPLWTFLMALFYLVGVDGFASSKLMAIVFVGASVPLVWGIAREARPAAHDPVPLLAATVLAGSAQFTIWAASGLENSLLNVLMAAGIWRALVEARRGGVPWSALLWLGVALTRPEGLMYAALGGGWSMVFRLVHVRRDVGEALLAGDLPALGRAIGAGLRPTLAWLAMFFVPFGLYQAWHLNYFAYELPNTYYAKKGNPTKSFEPYSWTTKGWKYIGEYAHALAQGYLLPVYIVAMSGLTRWRGALAGVLVLALAVVLLVPGPKWLRDLPWWDLPEPDGWPQIRVWTLLAVALLALVVALARPGWRALALCHSVAVSALFFALYAGGDWMNGFRWMASLTVPAAVLFAVGAGELADGARRLLDRRGPLPGLVVALAPATLTLVLGLYLLMPPRGRILWLGYKGRDPDLWFGLALPVIFVVVALSAALWARRERWGPAAWTVVLVLLSASVVPSVHALDLFISKPTTSPFSVQRRVNYMNYVQARLHVVGQPTTLDVDMGANMYWSGDRIVDIAGLVDVSMGHHWFAGPFMEEYLFEEKRPHFAHVHGGWARTSRIPTYKQWKEQYLEIDPYPTSKTSQHTGNHVRRDLFIQDAWHGPEGRQVGFEGGLELVGWHVPAGQAAQGGHLYVELGWRTLQPRQGWEDVRTLVFLAGDHGALHVWDAPPGYDWYEMSAWSPDEVVVGRYSLPVPQDLPAGRYALGVAVHRIEEGQRVQPALEVPEGALTDNPVFARGEVRWPGVVEIADRTQVEARALQEVEQARALAAAGDCAQAEAVWLVAQRRTTRSLFDERHREPVGRFLASCWATLAGTLPQESAQVDALERAHGWSPWQPDVVASARPLADRLMDRGQTARAAYDWELAYASFRDVLRIDPSRAWARRWAEQARDCRLGIRITRESCGQRVGRALRPLDEPAEPAPDLEGDGADEEEP